MAVVETSGVVDDFSITVGTITTKIMVEITGIMTMVKLNLKNKKMGYMSSVCTQKSANAGDSDAQYNLANFYYNGREGSQLPFPNARANAPIS
jgi:hypothetical protein